MQVFYAHSKAVAHVLVVSLPCHQPPSEACKGNNAGQGTRGHFIIFTCSHRQLWELSTRLTAFHLHIEILGEGCPSACKHYLHFYCTYNSLPIMWKGKRLAGARGSCYNLALLCCWPRCEKITCVCVSAFVCKSRCCLGMSGGNGKRRGVD